MGKKMESLLGRRSLRASKLKATMGVAMTRLSILKKQRQIRCSQTTSDVAQLLRLGHHEGALLRVDQILKAQHMLDALLIIHSYLSLLLDNLPLFHHHHHHRHSECPQELREAVCSLFFASSRIGDFPELLQIRSLLTSRFGEDLAAHSIELRANCPVNPTMVQKLSTRQPPLDLRLKVLHDIATENNIVLKLHHQAPASTKMDVSTKSELTVEACLPVGETVEDYALLPDSTKTVRKYNDVADAARAAFESAAHAAAAARAAVVLSQYDARGPDDHHTPTNLRTRRSFKDDTSDSEHDQEANKEDTSRAEGSTEPDGKAESMRSSMPDSSTDSEDVFTEEDLVKLLETDVVIYDSEEDTQRSTKAKVDADLMGGKKSGAIWHGQHMVSSSEGPGTHSAGAKGPVSVRTRHIRGY